MDKMRENTPKTGIKIALTAILLLGVFLYFGNNDLNSYEGESAQRASYQSSLAWRQDGLGDYVLPKIPAGQPYAIPGAVETKGDITGITASAEFKGKVTLEVSVDNGLTYTPAVLGVPLIYEEKKSGNQIKLRVTLGQDSELSQIKISYTDNQGTTASFGEPALSGFKYRRLINISNFSPEELFNYQVKVAAGELEADSEEVRFTAADGETLLPYYRESKGYWVKVPQIPKSGAGIYLYYGNASAEDLSNGSQTFDFFDGFSGGVQNLSAWQEHDFKQGSLEYKLKAQGQIKTLNKSALTKEEIIAFFKIGKNFDWARVRKLAKPEPVAGAMGIQEEPVLAYFSNTALAENGNVTLNEPGTKGEYAPTLLATACNIHSITPSYTLFSESRTGLTLDFSADGGKNWKKNCAKAVTYEAPSDFSFGKELKIQANLYSSDKNSLPGLEEITVNYDTAPAVTSENISVSGATGEKGVYRRGDAIIVQWDNSSKGDNNPDILSATVNLEAFGAEAEIKMYDDGKATESGDKKPGDNIYTARYALPDGLYVIGNIYVTAVDQCGSSTRDGHLLDVDTQGDVSGAQITGAEEELAVESKLKEEAEGLNKRYKIKFGKDEAEIGNFGTKLFQPYVKIKRWGEECYFSMEIPEAYISQGDRSVSRNIDKIEWDSTEVGARFYKKERKEIIENAHKFIKNENGGLEFEIVLNKKPDSNVISLPIDFKGLKFYYQGELTPEEITRGIVRPEEIIGSYAVYHESKKDKEYATGKAFHIYRPKLIDRKGDWVWGKLDIDTAAKALKITVDKSWLNKAAYPVTVDPEFGYMVIGSSAIPIQNIARGSIFTAGLMNPSSITAYLENVDAANSHVAKYAIYQASDSTLIGETMEVTVPAASQGWYEGLYTSPLSLSAQQYALTSRSDTQNILMYFDSGDPSQGVSQAINYADAWPQQAAFSYDDNIYSIYDATTATFTITATLDATLPTVQSVSLNPVSPVAAGTEITFTVTFSEDMKTATAPTIKCGTSAPYTTTTITAKSSAGYTNGYQDADINVWEGTVTPTTVGDYHISIAGAKDVPGNTITTDTANTFTISAAALASLKIRDAASNGGSEVTTHAMTTDDTKQVWAAGYDSYSNYRGDENVTWSVTGNFADADLTTTSGNTTTFSPDNTGTGTVTAAAGGITDATGIFTVTVGAATKLSFSTQPSAAATAGVAFAQQPVVAVQDAEGNTITSDSTTQITLSRGATGTDTLYGTLTKAVSSGVATFTDLYYEKAETMNISATHGGTSGSDTSIDFATEGNYTQEDATNGTDFADGAAQLHLGDAYLLDRINNLGGSGSDYFYSVVDDGTYYVAVGCSSSDLSGLTGGTTNAGSNDFVIAQFNKSDLSLHKIKNFGGTGADYFNGVIVHGSYYIAVGTSDSNLSGLTGGTTSTTDGSYVIAKINASDLSLNTINNAVGGTSLDRLYSVATDGTYYYAVGDTGSNLSAFTGGAAAVGSNDFVVIKYNASNLAFNRLLNFGGTSEDFLNGIIYDAGNLIAVGHSKSNLSGLSGGSTNTTGTYYFVITKLSTTPALSTIKNFGGSSADEFNSVVNDGTYYVAAGYSASDLSAFTGGSAASGNGDFVIAQFVKATLNLNKLNNFGGTGLDSLKSISYSSPYYIAGGYTTSDLSAFPGGGPSSSTDFAVVKVNVSDLSVNSVTNFGSSASDSIWGYQMMTVSGDDAAIVGHSTGDFSSLPGGSAGDGTNRFVIAKLNRQYPATPYYVTTTAGSQIDVSNWTHIAGVTTTETTPTDTSIKYLASFDGRTTWKYWSGSAWTASSLDNLQTEGMSKTTLEAITQAQWESTGGFNASTTTALDFAADLTTTDTAATPELDLITVNYVNDPGGSAYTSATSSDVVVSGAALNSFVVEAPASANAGTAFSTTITAKDTYNNTTKSVSGNTSLAVDSGTVSPTYLADTEFTDDGVWTGDITLKGVLGSVQITATNGTPTGNDTVSVSAGTDGTLTTSATLTEPATIASSADTEAEKVQVFDFTVSDSGADDLDLKLKQLIITRGANDTTGGWAGYIAGASITDGTTPLPGTVAADSITFGDASSVIYTVTDGESKTFTLSIWLSSSLPAATADGKVIEFDVNPNDDLTVDSSGSTFAAGDAVTSGSKPVIDVTSTKLNIITSEIPSSAVLNNNIVASLQVEAIDDNGIRDLGYTTNAVLAARLTNDSGDAPGTLSATEALTQAMSSGVITWTNVKYDTVGDIKLKVTSGALTEDISGAIAVAANATTTVDALTTPYTPQANFNLDPTNDAIGTKFPVLKFKITDAGGDSADTLIDQITVNISGTGANAATDIAWAELYDETNAAQVATAASITDSAIIFGSTPDSGSASALDTVPDSSNIRYTVNIYMKPTALTATDGQAYIFGINDASVGVDSGTSSQMGASVLPVSNVTGTITVTVSKLAVTGTATMNAGATNELAVRAKDANDNIDTGYTGSKSLTFSGLGSIDGNAPNIEGTGFNSAMPVNFSNGVSAAGALTLTAYKAESAYIDVTDQAYSSGAGVDDADDLNLTVNPLAVVKAGLSGPSSVVVAVTSDALTLTSKDTYGNASNVVSTSAFSLTSTSGGTTAFLYSGSPTNQVSIIANSNNVTFNYSDTKVGTPTITATCATGDIIGQQATHGIEVTPAALNYFTITGYPAATTAGDAFSAPANNIVITAYDAYGNLKTNYTGQVYFTSTDAQAVLPYTSGSKYTFTTGAGADNGTHTFSAAGFTLKSTASKTITITDGTVANASNAITVNPATLDSYTITGYPGTTTAGENFSANNIIITAKDAYGNTKTDYTGDIYFTSTDSQAVLPYTSGSPYTFLLSDNGTKTFVGTSFTLNTTPSKTITVTNGSVSQASNAITVNPAVLDSYTITGYPASTTAGETFGANDIVVTVKDAQGNVKTNYTGQIYFTSTDAQAVLPYTSASKYTFTSGEGQDNGVHTFVGTGFTLKSTASKTITVTDGTVEKASDAITINPAVLDSYTMTGYPTSTTAGDTFGSNNVIITAKDIYGNTKTDYTGQIYFTSTDAAAVLPYTSGSKYTFTSADSGTHTFVGTAFALKTVGAGTKTFTVTDGTLEEASTAITMTAAAASYYTVEGTASMTTGATNELTITAYDAYANLATGYTGNKSLTFSGLASAPLGTTPKVENIAFGNSVTIPFTSGVSTAGAATLSAYKVEADKTVAVTDGTILSTFGGTDYGLDLTVNLPATPDHFKVTTAGASSKSMKAGATAEVTVTAYDAYDNVSTNYASTHNLTFSGPSDSDNADDPTIESVVIGTLMSNVSFSSGVSAANTLTLVPVKAETAVLHVTDESAITSSGSSTYGLTLGVSGGDASVLAWDPDITMQTKVVKNAPFSTFKVNVTDIYGNVSPDTPTVTIGLSEGSGTLSGNTAVASSGVATFSNFSCASSGNIKIQGTSSPLTATAVFPAAEYIAVEDNYNITYTVKDSVTAAQLSEVTLTVYDAAGAIVWGPTQANGLFEDVLLPYAADGYSFEFAKEGYVTSTVSKKPTSAEDSIQLDGSGKYNNAISWSEYLISIQESLADYKVLSSFVYTEPSYDSDSNLKANTDELNVRIWLERRGKLVVNTDTNTLQSGNVEIFDGVTEIYTISSWDTSPDTTVLADEADMNGTYLVTIPHITTTGTGKLMTLVSGKTYFTRCNITWGGSSSDTKRTYTAGATFTITISEKLKEITDQIIAQVAGVQSLVSTEATTTRTSVAGISSAIQTKVETEVAGVKTETSKILTATGTESLPDKITEVKTQVVDEIEPSVTSGILNRENAVKQGGTVVVRYRGAATGLTPVVNVYSPKGVLLLANKSMSEIGSTGVYEYSVTFLSAWGLGDFSIICSESTKGTVDAMVMTVTQYDIESVSQDVSTVVGNTGGLTNLKTATATIGAQFNDMDKLLTKISVDVAGKLGGAKGAVAELTTAFKQLEDLSKQIKDIGGTTGINLEKLYEVSKDKKEDITYIKNKSEELKAAMEINQKMIEDVAKKPVVQTWFEFK